MTDIDEARRASASPKKRRWPWFIAALVFLLVVIGGYNATVWMPVSSALAGEDDVSLVAYRRWLLSPNTVVIDIRGIRGSASMADVDRNLFKAAEALKDHSFESVILAYRGTANLLMDGDAFQTIGRERAFQNPIYVMRTMQQDVKNLDGTPAFPALYGGWLGVLGEELNQHREFHERWWLNDSLGVAN